MAFGLIDRRAPDPGEVGRGSHGQAGRVPNALKLRPCACANKRALARKFLGRIPYGLFSCADDGLPGFPVGLRRKPRFAKPR